MEPGSQTLLTHNQLAIGCAVVTSNPALTLSHYKENRVLRIEQLKKDIAALKPS